MSLTTKLSLFVIAFFVFFALGAWLAYTYMRQIEASGAVLNIAGRQRMLTQLIAKEALLSASGNEPARSVVSQWRQEFSANQEALVNGDSHRGVPKPPLPVARNLVLVSQRWQTLSASVLAIERSPVGSPAFNQSLDYILKNNEALLWDIDTIVSLYEDYFRERVRLLWIVIWGDLLAILALTIAGYFYNKRLISDPLTRLAAAARRVAQGEALEIYPPDLRRGDEIGILNSEVSGCWKRIIALGKEAEQGRQRLQEACMAIMRTLILIIETHDPYLRGHAERHAQLARLLGRNMGLSDEEQEHLQMGAKMHDIGKIGIPNHILLKPGPLTPQEWSEMHRHPALAVDMLRFLDFLAPVLPLIENEHERWDGQGYPRGLKGEAIPLGARILAITDAYDAMTSERPYKTKLSQQEATEELKRGSGSQWDPRVVEAFLELIADNK